MKNRLIWGLLSLAALFVLIGTVNHQESMRQEALRSCVQEVVDYLSAHHPLTRPVEIVLRDLGDVLWGTADLIDGTFVLTVDDGTEPGYLAEETAIHEWAHFMSWPDDAFGPPPPSWHHDGWGRAYSKCYRSWFEEVN